MAEILGTNALDNGQKFQSYVFAQSFTAQFLVQAIRGGADHPAFPSKCGYGLGECCLTLWITSNSSSF